MVGYYMKMMVLVLVFGGWVGIVGVVDFLLDLVGLLFDYKIYVVENIVKLVEDIIVFIDVVKVGDLDKVKMLFVFICISYEKIEFIVELFFDLDVLIDVCVDDFEQVEQDLKFIGFYCIEYGLFSQNLIEGLG